MYKYSYDEEDLISAGSIVFEAGDDLTTEKKTENILLNSAFNEIPRKCLLAIEKPIEDTAGDLTVSMYNIIAIDGNNERDTEHTTLTVGKIAGVETYKGFLIDGLFRGQGKIKIGMNFTTDSGAITVKYRLLKAVKL